MATTRVIRPASVFVAGLAIIAMLAAAAIVLDIDQFPIPSKTWVAVDAAD